VAQQLAAAQMIDSRNVDREADDDRERAPAAARGAGAQQRGQHRAARTG